ncbi:hypothetical protein V8G54_002267, partial [Vigna mungo]
LALTFSLPTPTLSSSSSAAPVAWAKTPLSHTSVRHAVASTLSSPPNCALAAPPKSTARTTSLSRRRSFSGWWSGRNCLSTPLFLRSVFRTLPREREDKAFEEF